MLTNTTNGPRDTTAHRDTATPPFHDTATVAAADIPDLVARLRDSGATVVLVQCLNTGHAHGGHDIDADTATLDTALPADWAAAHQSTAVRRLDEILPGRSAPHIADLLARRGITVTDAHVRKTRHRDRQAQARRATIPRRTP